jgi:hypothetical protein
MSGNKRSVLKYVEQDVCTIKKAIFDRYDKPLEDAEKRMELAENNARERFLKKLDAAVTKIGGNVTLRNVSVCFYTTEDEKRWSDISVPYSFDRELSRARTLYMSIADQKEKAIGRLAADHDAIRRRVAFCGVDEQARQMCEALKTTKYLD